MRGILFMSIVSMNGVESRFKKITGITVDLTQDRIKENNAGNQQQLTTSKESNEFGFVTTPMWIVDDMIYIVVADSFL